MNDISLITIDGSAGSGKGTLAKRLSHELEWHLLDSGAIYRLLAFAACKNGIALDDEAALVALTSAIKMEFIAKGGAELEVLLDGEDVTRDIRTEDCGCNASVLAVLPKVREALLDRQKSFRQAPGLVADGRDMGTVVFPDAPLKIFLLASAEVRAERRFGQLKEKGIDANMDRLIRDIVKRDERDCNRKQAPLKPADDAIQIDTDKMSIEEVFSKVYQLSKNL
ncbi:MAG: Cytidylate kinase (EC [uncultured Thiotrichaceae bacterium]|uniref:Cytidylate kinase n=1 Tax=uncultured Thiotrichaceae bacterium TaxID=298394 RepID=A0A6S6UCT9_9GAMM|nr:MAG: Cytidylate kinase (EC [uncultured Thiotrichaceae bacterium]